MKSFTRCIAAFAALFFSVAAFAQPSQECSRCLQAPSFIGGWLVVPENIRTIENSLTSYNETLPPVTISISGSIATANGSTTYTGVVSQWSLFSLATVTTYKNVPGFAKLEYFEPIPNIWVFPSSRGLFRVVQVDLFLAVDGSLQMQGSFSAKVVQDDPNSEDPNNLNRIHIGTARLLKKW